MHFCSLKWKDYEAVHQNTVLKTMFLCIFRNTVAFYDTMEWNDTTVYTITGGHNLTIWIFNTVKHSNLTATNYLPLTYILHFCQFHSTSGTLYIEPLVTYRYVQMLFRFFWYNSYNGTGQWSLIKQPTLYHCHAINKQSKSEKLVVRSWCGTFDTDMYWRRN
jgi:WD40 repeat protein